MDHDARRDFHLKFEGALSTVYRLRGTYLLSKETSGIAPDTSGS